MKCLIAIIGPTAVGKTKLALQLAKDFNGEIVNADSRQVYRFMDIGTAKPDNTDQSAVPHHLVDIIDPDMPYNLAVYKKLAYEAIEDIQGRQKLPFLVGGSGLYIWSVLEGWSIPHVFPDAEFRHRLEAVAKERGIDNLYQELCEVDPVAAAKIMPGNLRRVIRALEIYQATGKPASDFWQKEPPPFHILIIGLTVARKLLYKMIDFRVEGMIESGFVDEVRGLSAKGYSTDLPSMSGIGYSQINNFIRGELDLLEAVERIKYETHRFARHQYAWFRLNDARIHWFNASDNIESEVNVLVRAFIDNVGNKEEGYEFH